MELGVDIRGCKESRSNMYLKLGLYCRAIMRAGACTNFGEEKTLATDL